MNFLNFENIECNSPCSTYHVDARFVYAFQLENNDERRSRVARFCDIDDIDDDEQIDMCLNIRRLYASLTAESNGSLRGPSGAKGYHVHIDTIHYVAEMIPSTSWKYRLWIDYMDDFIYSYIDAIIDEDDSEISGREFSYKKYVRPTMVVKQLFKVKQCSPVKYLSSVVIESPTEEAILSGPSVEEIFKVSECAPIEYLDTLVLDLPTEETLLSQISQPLFGPLNNSPIDLHELAERERAEAEKRRFLLHKPIKTKKWVPKTYKKPKTRSTVDLNTITPLVKKRYIELGITASTTEDFDRVWFMRPSTYNKSSVCRWEKWADTYKPSVNDMLQLHFAALPERDGLPSAINLRFYHFKPELRNGKDYSALYESVLQDHLIRQAHHPEGKSLMTPMGTVELMCDLWACAMRYHDNWNDAYKNFHQWLCTVDRGICQVKEKFSSLNPAGLGMFYSCLARHGVSKKSYNYAMLTRKRFNDPLSMRAQTFDWSKPVTVKSYRAISKMPEFEAYVLDTKIHVSIVNSLMAFWTDQEVRHDNDKASWESLLGYTYNWVVKPKLEKLQQQQVEATTDDGCPNCANPFCKNRDPAGECNLSDNSFTHRFFEKVKSFGSSFKDAAKNLVPSSLTSLLSTLQHQLSELGNVVKSLLGRIQAVLSPILKFLKLDSFALDSSLTLALDIVRYYVIYINTDSTAIHALCCFAILHTLGIYEHVYNSFVSWMGDGVLDPEVETDAPEATMDLNIFSHLKNMFANLTSLDPATVAIPLGFLVVVFCGITLKGKELASLGKDFVGSMRNMHFIGGGILGITRLFDALVKSIRFILEWIGKKFYAKVPEDEQKAADLEQLVKDFTSWSTEVYVLSGEEILPRLATDTRLHGRVESCYSRGINFSKLFYEDKLPPRISYSFNALWKTCRELHNIMMRSKMTHDFRPTPFHVQMYGDPGIGKSTLMHTISRKIGDKYYPHINNLVYSQGLTEQMDNYLQQPIFLYDDIFAANDYKMIVPLLMMISNCPLMFQTSHLWSKGTMFTSEWYLSGTNTPWPYCNNMFKHEPVWRRSHILVQVTIDPDVKDPATGKFCSMLYKKKYGNIDSRTYPHLKFTLMNPIKEGEELGEVKDLPTGIIRPTKDLTYDEFMERVFSRFEAQRSEEALFKGDSNARYVHIHKHLAEIDEVYEKILEATEYASPLYKNNLDDGGRKTQPAAHIPTAPEYIPPEEKLDVPLISEEKIFSEIRQHLLENCGATEDLQASMVMTLLDKIEHAFRHYNGKFLCLCNKNDNFIGVINMVYELYLVQLSIANHLTKRDDYTIMVNRFNNIRTMLHHTKFCNRSGQKKTHAIVETFTQEVLNSCMEEVVKEGIDVEDMIKIYASLQFLAVEYKIVLPRVVPESKMEILARALKIDLPEATTSVDDDLSYHISIDTSDEELAQTLLEKQAELVATQKLILKLFDDNPDDASLMLFRDVVVSHLHESEPNFFAYRSALEDVVLQNSWLGDELKKHPLLKKLISNSRLCGVIASHISVIQVEIRTREIFARRNMPRANRTSYNDESSEGIYFASQSNYKKNFGFCLRANLSHGLTIRPTWYSAPVWVPYPPQLVELIDTLTTGYGNIYLSKEEWSVFFPNEPFTNGDSGIENLLLRYMKMGPPFHRKNQKSFYFEAKGMDKLCNMINSHSYAGVKLSVSPTQLLAGRSTFRKSISRFTAMSQNQQELFFCRYSKHWFITNFLLSINQKIINGSIQLFDKVWSSITGGISFMWEKVKRYKKAISLLVLSGAIIGGCTMFAKLFVPESTSFRGSKIFAQQHKGVSSFTANSPAKKAVEGTIRCMLDGGSFQGYKIWESCLLVPWHAVSAVKAQPRRSFYLTLLITKGVTHTFTITSQNIHYFEGSDCALIYQVNFPAWGQRLKYLKSSAEFESEKGEVAIVAYRDIDGSLVSEETLYEGTQQRVTTKFGDGLAITHSFVGVLQGFVNKGVSGSPIFLQTINSDQMTIAGFQSYRHNGFSYYTMVSREAVEKAIEVLALGIVKSGLPFALSEEPVQETSLAILDPHMELVGSVPVRYRTAQPPNTEFVKTRIYDAFPTQRVPAILSPSSPYFDRSQIDPARHSINKHGRDSMREIPQQFLDQAVREYVTYYSRLIRKPRVYSIVEAIEGVGSLKHIDLNTSPGIPWIFHRTDKGKKSFIEIDELGNLTHLDPQLVLSCSEFEESFQNLQSPNFTMVEILKDELRPIGKAYGLTDEQVQDLYLQGIPPALWPTPRVCKTRTITVMPMEFTIIYRRYFADFFSQLYSLANTGTQSYCVGINCESMAAYQSYAAAKCRNDFGIDLDISNWDGHFSPQLFRAVVSVANGVYRDEFSNLRLTLALSACFGHVQYRDMVYKKYWGMPSGFPGTADFNTVGHMLVGYAQWLEACINAGRFELCYLDVYQRYVLDLYYGDDRLIVVHPDVSDIFNVQSLTDLYAKYGWPVTSAAKTGTFDLVPICDLQFLKRRWIIDPLNPLYVHWAMDKNTIEDLCAYVRRSFEPRKQFYENLYTSLDFACDWSQQYYEKLAYRINTALGQKRMRPVAYDYNSKYREKRRRYMGIDSDSVFHPSQTNPLHLDMGSVKEEDLVVDSVEIIEHDLSPIL